MLKTTFVALVLAASAAASTPTPPPSPPPGADGLAELQLPPVPCLNGVCLIREQDLDLLQAANAGLAARARKCTPGDRNT